MKYISQKLPEKLQVNEIFSFYIQNFEEDFIFKGESHDFAELVCVHSGSVGITADERAYELTDGMSVLHKPGEFHAIRSLGGTTPRVTILSFSSVPAVSSAIFNTSPEQAAILEIISARLSENVSSSYDGNSVSISIDDSEEGLQIVKNLLEAFLLLCDFGDKIIPRRTEKDMIFSDLVKYMQEHIAEKLSTEDLCRHTGLGRTYLKTLFKQYTGMGIMHYFLLLKLKKSAELLLSGKPVGTVSEELGFSSQNYFSYAFKKQYSLTPMKYKEKLSEKNIPFDAKK